MQTKIPTMSAMRSYICYGRAIETIDALINFLNKAASIVRYTIYIYRISESRESHTVAIFRLILLRPHIQTL